MGAGDVTFACESSSDDSVPCRIALRTVVAERLPVTPTPAIKSPHNLSITRGQLAIQFLRTLHPRPIHIDKSEVAFLQTEEPQCRLEFLQTNFPVPHRLI